MNFIKGTSPVLIVSDNDDKEEQYTLLDRPRSIHNSPINYVTLNETPRIPHRIQTRDDSIVFSDNFNTERILGQSLEQALLGDHYVDYNKKIVLGNQPFESDDTIYIEYNNDYRLHKAVMKYFRKKTYDKWLFNKLGSILGYIKINNSGDVSLIEDISNFDEDAYMKDNRYTNDMKVDFIKRNFLTYEFMYKILKSIVKESNYYWQNLYDEDRLVRRVIGKELVRKIKKRIYGSHK